VSFQLLWYQILFCVVVVNDDTLMKALMLKPVGLGSTFLLNLKRPEYHRLGFSFNSSTLVGL
jgi:hypothetical protein